MVHSVQLLSARLHPPKSQPTLLERLWIPTSHIFIGEVLAFKRKVSKQIMSAAPSRHGCSRRAALDWRQWHSVLETEPLAMTCSLFFMGVCSSFFVSRTALLAGHRQNL